MACLTIVVTLTVSIYQNQGSTVLCDAATCLYNTPPKPEGIMGEPPAPRVLTPEEMEKMKHALHEEETLEAEVIRFLLTKFAPSPFNIKLNCRSKEI